MNNEEKILSALEALTNSVNVQFGDVSRRLDGMDKRFDNIESDIAVIKEEITDI